MANIVSIVKTAKTVKRAQEVPIVLSIHTPPENSTEAVVAVPLSIRISEASMMAKSQHATRATLILIVRASDAKQGMRSEKNTKVNP